MPYEPYQLDKLDFILLQKILRVLDDIQRKSDIEGKEGFFDLGDFGTAGVSWEEYKQIFWNLSYRRYFRATMNYGVMVQIDEHFGHFREEVAQEIAKRKTLLKLNNTKAKDQKPHYDSVNKSLWVKGIEIKKIIGHKAETIQEDILKMMFLDNADNLGEIYDYTANPLGEVDFDKENGWQTFRNAFRELNRKILDGSNNVVDNFFLFGKSPNGNFQINPKYL